MGRATRSPLGAKTTLPLFAAVVRPIQAFLRLEAASGIVLLSCAVAALVLANSGASEVYRAILGAPVELAAGPLRARFSVAVLVNDGLMTIFFFVVGLEIKRELAVGELRTLPQAVLPAIAALGGMLFPAALFLAFNWNGPGRAGWGIPMATDIAFCVGVLTLLRSRVPHALVVFVTALAIFDDIGGILVIALFYGHGLDVVWLAVAAGVTAALVLMSRAYVRTGFAYAVAGALLWYALHHAGIHATIAGIVVGLSVPARPRSHPRQVLAELAAHAGRLVRTAADEELDSAAILEVEERLDSSRRSHASSICSIRGWPSGSCRSSRSPTPESTSARSSPPSSRAGSRWGPRSRCSSESSWASSCSPGSPCAPVPRPCRAARLGEAAGRRDRRGILGVATVAGIGFTVALFIAGLAYPASPDLLDEAKVGILAGSLVSGIVGAVMLRFTRATAESRSGERGATRVEGETGVG